MSTASASTLVCTSPPLQQTAALKPSKNPVNMYSKYLDFPDAPVVDPNTPWQPAGHYFANGPRIHEFIHEMNVRAFKKYGLD